MSDCASSEKAADAAELMRTGCTVSDLRKRGFTPKQIREAGFSLSQMRVYLGVHLLNEAGFSLQDYAQAKIPLSEIADHFSVDELVRSKLFSVQDLAQRFSLSSLRNAGCTVKDFLSLPFVTEEMLRNMGFNDKDVAAAGLPVPFLGPPRTTAMQPSHTHARDMKIGETWTKTQQLPKGDDYECDRDNDYCRYNRGGGNSSEYNNSNETDGEGDFLEVTYSLLPTEEATQLRARPHWFVGHGPRVNYVGSGRLCPRCGRLFVLVERHFSETDPNVVSGKWMCGDAVCGMVKEERSRCSSGSIL